MMCFTSRALDWLCLILQERFGHKFILSYQNKALKLSLAGQTQNYILFPRLIASFFQSRSDIPCCLWDAKREGWHNVLGLPIPAPGVSGLQNPLIRDHSGNIEIYYDILGLVYWMLNRVEEIGRTDLDSHGRFPAINCHAYKNNYLERPIIDEWLYILSQVIKRIWPQLELKKQQFSIKVSHDVDRPSRYGFASLKKLPRLIAGDMIKRNDFMSIIKSPIIYLSGKNKLHPMDIFNTFDWIMDVSEKHNLKSAFYFICGHTDPVYDADYKPEDTAIRKLLRQIHARGHEIGLHPSYNTYLQPQLIAQEFNRLRNLCDEEGIQQAEWGGRMHYLRWQQPITLQAWNDAKLSYDSTLGYADRAGFRCGTCYEYPAFNPITKRILDIRIRPLIVMECSVISIANMGLKIGTESTDKILQLKENCRSVGGCFTLLWHNSEFESVSKKAMYQTILKD
ncbi:polysaccharide deacetylase family protein [Candidatus Arsenophonus nilaparvatae]|uniref:polysaccharide deacetylase family protein n=1 Tax=Candidatus Arsenophonus nilaparvatae TaxID=1247023 RepID=UPI00050942CB|nr:polysaccharide deacetylase family protein [Candidatus Arsenophonus nilaparvatae]